MADKILRPITDVEIVEQMTENDTVLIEQNGVIKRTKGVVGGGGGKYVIRNDYNTATGAEVWSLEGVTYEELMQMFTEGTALNGAVIFYENGDAVSSCGIFMIEKGEFDPEETMEEALMINSPAGLIAIMSDNRVFVAD